MSVRSIDGAPDGALDAAVMSLDVLPAATDRGHIRVAVFDRRPLAADGFAALLARCGEVTIVGIGTGLGSFLRLVASARADVVVIGVAPDALLAMVRLLGRIPAAQLAEGPRVVAVVSGDQDLADLISAPFVTVITTRLDPVTLCNVVMGVTSSRLVAIPAIVVRPPATLVGPVGTPGGGLTPREREVLRGIEDGLSTNEIASCLGIAPNTVRTHAQRLMTKLSVHSRVQAAAIAAGQERMPRAGG